MDGKTCRRRGAHYCEPRADRVVKFFSELLVHTKGPLVRHKFVPGDWQEYEILRPVFGEVVWSREWKRYVRRYRVVIIVLGRKNGKSELAAGILLYLLVGDDEEAAEIYGAAKDTKQAGKVFQPALRMVQLSPALRKRLKHNKHARRIYDEKTSSYYEIITADALGELGHNPHGFVLDEVLSQPDDSLWNAVRTASGTRTQPLNVIITTETNKPISFGASTIDEAERVQADPARSPHTFAYVRKTPMDADPWDEKNWGHANPALGSFLSIQALREEALDARNDPTKENSFRQYRLNQRVQQNTRFMPLHLWDGQDETVWLGPDHRLEELRGRLAFGGLDLSSKIDLTALQWLVVGPDGELVVVSRCWIPAGTVGVLDKQTAGEASVWVRQGWLTVTDGDVIDYEAIYDQLAADAGVLGVRDLSADPWLLEPVRQEIEKRTGVDVHPVYQTFKGLSEATKQLMVLTKKQLLRHGRNPVLRYCMDSLEVKTDDQENIRPVKPDRDKTGKRIDAAVALIHAIDGWMRRADQEEEGPPAFSARSTG